MEELKMKVEDANKVIESFRKQGYTDEQIQQKPTADGTTYAI